MIFRFFLISLTKLKFSKLTELIISTKDYSSKRLKLDSSEWISELHGSDNNFDPDSWIVDANKIKRIEYKYFNDNPEWSLIGVKVE